MQTKGNEVPIIVTVDDHGLTKFAMIMDQLKAMGMNIVRVMPKLGVISGTTTSNLTKLRSIDGVESVEPDEEHPLLSSKSKLQS